ncbi:hypothetical protein MHLNE_03900 [Moorella humiferrea]
MNSSYHKNFVLDAYAVICYLEDETGFRLLGHTEFVIHR